MTSWFSRRGLTGISLAAVLLAGAPAVNAFPTTLIYINDADGNLYSYDAANSFAETLIASSIGAFSISSGPAANTIYIQDAATPLTTYDLISNTLTLVGGMVFGNALGEGRDGFLYAGLVSSLYRVDPNTGASTLIGDGTYEYAGDLAVDPTDLDAMYGAVLTPSGVSLARIDKNTGAHTLIGSFNLGVDASIFGLGFSLDGILYAAGPTGSGAGEIYIVDKTTGAATPVHTLSYEPYDMATQPFEVAESAVPEPAALALLGLGLAGLGFSRRRK